ncbi:MAG: hypothetical protein H6855_04610 [Rhodospirillales bacterium]|nr:hypothetical protein [Rhodospirillales bacterium]
MIDFNTSLLREKFILQNILSEETEEESVTVLSNRIVVPLISRRGEVVETFVVRGHNMHTTLRIAAKLVQSFQQGEKITTDPDFDWEGLWQDVIEGFERAFNPEIWAAVYFEGKCLFQKGTHHPFLDIIEKFDAAQQDDYERALKMAEKAFKDAGKPVTISHDTNVALVVSINSKQARCGIILRGAGRTTTFNYTAKEQNATEIVTSQCLSVAAAFLEGLHLAFTVGMGKRKIHYNLLDNEEERKRTFAGEKRLGRLMQAINHFDQTYLVTYRPERPDLFGHITEAEKFADKILKAKLKTQIKDGTSNGSDWVT